MADTKRSYEPHDRLTHLANEMLEVLKEKDAKDVRAIVMLNTDERGGIGLGNYEDEEAGAIADMFIHLKALFEAQGKTLMIAPLQGNPGDN